MNPLKRLGSFIGDLLINYKQAIFGAFLAVALFFPVYVMKDIQIQSLEIESMSEQINILSEVQKTITFHENEIEIQREFIQRQNSLINQLMMELQKMRGIPTPPQERPPRSEA